MKTEELYNKTTEELYDEIVETLSSGNFLTLNGKPINLSELSDYINAQQQEIERLNKRIKELEEGFKATTEDLCEESTKIEKAIKYIEEHTTYENYGYIDELQLIDLDFSIKDLKQILDKENNVRTTD